MNLFTKEAKRHPLNSEIRLTAGIDMQKLILIALQCVLVAFFVSTANGQVKLTWKVEKFDLDVTLPADANSDRALKVKAKLDLRNQSSRAFRTVTLRINEAAEVKDVKANGAIADFTKGVEKVSETSNLQKVRVRVPSVNGGGKVSLEVNYTFNVNSNSGLNSITPNDAQFLPFAFWYPAPTSWFFPTGADAAPVDLTVRNLNGREVVSSGSFANGKYSNPLRGMPFFVAGKWSKSVVDGVEVYAPEERGR